MRILIIEDEKEIALFLRKVLVKESYAVDVAINGIDGERLALTEPYDLIILDLLLPGKEGIPVLETLRKEGVATPVLILTARGEVPDRVKGLDAGADDYLVKPFEVAELRARIRALLRRNSNQKSAVLVAGNLSLDPVSHEVKVSGTTVELTTREFAILEYLLRNKNRLLSKGMIADHVWDYHFDSDFNLIEVYIKRLRQKIEPLLGCRVIQTVRNSGYKFVDPVK